MKTLGERAKIALKLRNLQVNKLAETMGKKQPTVSNYLSSRSCPNEEFFIAFKKLIPDISLDWLITGEGEMFIGSFSPINETRERQLQHEIDDLKTAQAQLLRSMSALSTTILDKQAPQDGRSFNQGVRETGRRIANFIEKYTAAHTPLVAEVATA